LLGDGTEVDAERPGERGREDGDGDEDDGGARPAQPDPVDRGVGGGGRSRARCAAVGARVRRRGHAPIIADPRRVGADDGPGSIRVAGRRRSSPSRRAAYASDSLTTSNERPSVSIAVTENASKPSRATT